MVNYLKVAIAPLLLTAFITGCSTKNQSNDLLSEKEREIERLTHELQSTKKSQADVEERLKTLEAEREQLIAKEKKKGDAGEPVRTEKEDIYAVSNSLVPPNAKPGECYAKVLVPAKYRIEELEVLVKEPKTVIKVIPAKYKVVEKKVSIREPSIKLVPVPAKYKTVTEKVLVEPEKTKLVVVPATYKTVTEKVMVEPEKTKLVVVPAKYKTVTEKVLVKAAHTEWKRGRGEIEKIDNATGEIMCLVEVPAQYKTVTKKVLVKDSYTKEVKIPAVYKTITKRVVDKPAHTKEVKIPAVYKTVTKRVVDKPAHTKEVKIPAVYKTITKEVLVTPATTKEVKVPGICKIVRTRVVDTPAKEVKTTIPAVYKTVKKRVIVSEPYLRWQPVLCKTNTQPDIISKLQKKLKEKGYKISKVNGKYNAETKAAVREYQKKNNLSQGALTLKTLQSLGL